ncbi:hypothetical protein E6H36_12670 [Candidatus Bathyarchaeota archaeon]|nr:MAG: hypothetical protein E6H36_12670 [Candidatus Bathyarchaeota archaeon]
MPLQDKAPATWNETEYHPCTIEDVKEVYQLADVRARFVLNILTSTGLSNEDLAVMRLGDGIPSILEQVKTQERIIVRLSRAKTKVPFRTVLGQTCVQDLKAYLQYRQSKGEQLSADSALIVGERQGVVDYRDVYRIIRTPAQQAGKPWFTPKLIRKVFNQVVKNKGFHDHAEYWMGHKLPTERAAYFSNMPDKEMIEAYRKVEKDLNIKDSGLVVADESRLKLDIMLDTIKFSHPELHSEFLRLRQERETQGRALSTKEALAWLNTESMKRGPTGGLAWTQLNKKDKLSKVLAQLAEVLGEPEDS